MKKQVIRLTESDLHKIIKESVKQIIKEKQVKEFTPYSKEDREENFKGLTHGTPEDRNPSYAKAKKAAQERMAKKKGNKKSMEESSLNELDPRTYASYASKRQAQGQMAKAQQGVNAAQNAWNQKYGFSYNNGQNDWGEQKMGGVDNFTHNGNTNYGVNYRSERPNWEGNGYTHTNMAYNPKDDTVWKGNGRGESSVTANNHAQEMGDNGAYRTAREMQNGNGKYVKGQGWQ